MQPEDLTGEAPLRLSPETLDQEKQTALDRINRDPVSYSGPQGRRKLDRDATN